MRSTIEKKVFCKGSPRECGRQYGEQAAEEIRREVKFFDILKDPTRFDRFTAYAEESLRTFVPEILDELTGISEGSGVGLKDLLFINIWDSFDDEQDRCTPVLLQTSDHGPVIAKNNDGPERERNMAPFIYRHVEPDHGMPFIQVTYAGWLSGLDMMNSEGLANTHGSVGSCFPRGGNRLDIRLRMYQLMRQCRTAQELTSQLDKIPLTGKGFSILVEDKDGHNALIDAAVPKIVCSGTDMPCAFSTNLYTSPELKDCDRRKPEARLHNQGRRAFLQDFFAHHTLTRVEEVQQLLRTHGEFAPCRHVPCCPSATFWSMICLPAERKLLLAPGAPCEAAYETYEI